MEQNIFLQECFKIIQCLWQQKKNIKCFSGTTRINSWKSNGMSEENFENIENIPKSDNNFASTFVDHYLLPDINFNEHCSIKSNISIPKKVINLIFLTQ